MDRKITWRSGRTEIAPSLPYGCRTRGGVVAWDSGTAQPGESCDHGKSHRLGGDKLPLQMSSKSVCVCVLLSTLQNFHFPISFIASH